MAVAISNNFDFRYSTALMVALKRLHEALLEHPPIGLRSSRPLKVVQPDVEWTAVCAHISLTVGFLSGDGFACQ